MKICSQRLTKTDAKKRLSLRSRALRHLPRFKDGKRAQDLPVADEMGKTWTFGYRIREGRYKKTELSTGWLNFVNNKGLKTGDKIRFFKEKEVRVFGAVLGYTSYHQEEDEATGLIVRYRIEVMKEVRVFGAVFGYNSYHQAGR